MCVCVWVCCVCVCVCVCVCACACRAPGVILQGWAQLKCSTSRGSSGMLHTVKVMIGFAATADDDELYEYKYDDVLWYLCDV